MGATINEQKRSTGGSSFPAEFASPKCSKASWKKNSLLSCSLLIKAAALICCFHIRAAAANSMSLWTLERLARAGTRRPGPRALRALTTALSTAEAEYYSASTAGSEVLYLRKLLERMGFARTSPAPVYEDNTACIEWGNNVIGGWERATHIDIRQHLAHKVIQNGEMLLVSVPTASQLADIFTKGLQYPQWQACVEGILGRTFEPS